MITLSLILRTHIYKQSVNLLNLNLCKHSLCPFIFALFTLHLHSSSTPPYASSCQLASLTFSNLISCLQQPHPYQVPSPFSPLAFPDCNLAELHPCRREGCQRHAHKAPFSESKSYIWTGSTVENPWFSCRAQVRSMESK